MMSLYAREEKNTRHRCDRALLSLSLNRFSFFVWCLLLMEKIIVLDIEKKQISL
jgi:hypothetical protein